jgi:DNA-binding response OmpR family regulator
MYRVLIVDDDSLIQQVLRQTLKQEGFEVILCSRGQEALPAALQNKPDLIVLDVNLPDIEGHDVCRLIKGESKTRHIPILMLTGEARATPSVVSGLNLGAEDYLFKPISGKVLVSRIRAILKIATKPTK